MNNAAIFPVQTIAGNGIDEDSVMAVTVGTGRSYHPGFEIYPNPAAQIVNVKYEGQTAGSSNVCTAMMALKLKQIRG